MAKLDQLVEFKYINNFVDHLNYTQHPTEAIENPIVSVTNSMMLPHQSIPDAILRINETFKWLELTIFSRSPEMHKDMFKKANGFSVSTNIRCSAIGSFNSLLSEAGIAIWKKMQNDYSQFAQRAQIPQPGILLIMFIYQDPFFNYCQWKEFINIIKNNKRFLEDCGIADGCFGEIFVGAWVRTHTNLELLFEQIMDPALAQQIREWVNYKAHRLLELKQYPTS